MSDDSPYNPRVYAELVKRMAEMQIELNEAKAQFIAVKDFLERGGGLLEQLATAQRQLTAAEHIAALKSMGYVIFGPTTGAVFDPHHELPLRTVHDVLGDAR